MCDWKMKPCGSTKLLAELFQKDVRIINEHVKNTFAEGELEPQTTIRKFRIVQSEGPRQAIRDVAFYNLDMIISVGYRVKSLIATRFRIRATPRLKEYIVKGFVMDDERLKNPPGKGSAIPDYFDELLARIRDIRASETFIDRFVYGVIFVSSEFFSPVEHSAGRFAQTCGACLNSL
jgi:hypothetical protein